MTGGNGYVLRVEGVNFASTVEDTHDLSTIRGAGLALLRIGDALERGLAGANVANSHPIFSGASQAAMAFTADEASAQAALAAVRDELAKPGPDGAPLQHLSFVADLAEGSEDAALTVAEARSHARQYRQWTLPLPERSPSAAAFDPFDRARPATVRQRLPRGKVSASGDDWLSPSVAARREYGRAMRQAFYQREVGEVAKGLAFADSFQDLVDAPPEGLPPSVRPRMAVFYADGNRFGRIREKVGVQSFGDQLARHRKRLLAALLSWYRAGMRSDLHAAFASEGATRVETLRWGGDEMIFVLPCWLAFAFVEGFFGHTRGWTVQDAHKRDYPLTHAAGVVICDHKTPIRQARKLAEDVAESVKQAMGEKQVNAVGFEILESIAPPDAALDAHRLRALGHAPGDEAARAEIAGAFALPGDEFGALRGRLRELSGRENADGPALPRSQLFRVLKQVRSIPQGMASREAHEKAREMLEDYEKRVLKKQEFTVEGFRLPRLAKARSLALELALLASFQDYFDPFADFPLPPFPAADATP